jgi:hypothetical protein
MISERAATVRVSVDCTRLWKAEVVNRRQFDYWTGLRGYGEV